MPSIIPQLPPPPRLPKGIFNLLFLDLFLLSLSRSLSVAAETFPQPCLSSPFPCGEVVKIDYPFWLINNSSDSSFCGYSGMGISCLDDSYPVLRIGDYDYNVTKIENSTRTISLTDAQIGDGGCPHLRHNFTIRDSALIYSSNANENITFFFNCSSDNFKGPIEHQIECLHTNNSYVFEQDELNDMEYHQSPTDCKEIVVAPVLRGVLQNFTKNNISMLKSDFQYVLRSGFELQWQPEAGDGACRKCESSGGRCGHNGSSNSFTCFCKEGEHRIRNHCESAGSSEKKIIIIAVTASVGLFILLGAIVLLVLMYKQKMRRQYPSSKFLFQGNSTERISKDPETSNMHYQTRVFTYQELQEATNFFDDLREIGDGGFGTVYKGNLKDGRVVAIKRLYENNFKRVEQFMNEVEILSRLRHPNLVSLYGCTSRHSRELLLVYEFVPNGTVADHLHGSRACEAMLTWPVRLNIAIETATALAYLHAVTPPIIHRDVKTNNILLDENFHVKVADFGLSRLFPTDVTHVSTAPQGTPGYLDPEYHQCYQLTSKSDVYSFGVVLIELISSKPAVDITRTRREINLANMAISKIQNGEIDKLVEPKLGYESNQTVKKMIIMVAELAFRCLQTDGDMRPSLKEALEILQAIESEGYEDKKDIEDAHNEDKPLRNDVPVSPDTVFQKWVSSSTTPNISE